MADAIALPPAPNWYGSALASWGGEDGDVYAYAAKNAVILLKPAASSSPDDDASAAVERGVFSDLWLHALIGAGRRAEARAALDALLRRKGYHLSVRRFATLIDA